WKSRRRKGGADRRRRRTRTRVADWITGSGRGAPATGGGLADDDAKLVGYFLGSLERDHERVIPASGDTIIVTDNMSDEAFVSFAVARYLQKRKVAKPNFARDALEYAVSVLADLTRDLATRDQLRRHVQLLATERQGEVAAAAVSARDEL